MQREVAEYIEKANVAQIGELLDLITKRANAVDMTANAVYGAYNSDTEDFIKELHDTSQA